MKSTSASQSEHAPRRGRPAASVTLLSARTVEMDDACFAQAVDAFADVIRLDWDLASALLDINAD